MSDPPDALPTDDDLDAAMDELSAGMILNGMGMVHAFYLQSGGGPMGMRDLVAALWCAMRATQILEWRAAGARVRRKPKRGSVH